MTPAFVGLLACGRSEPGDYLFGDPDGASGSSVSGSTGVGGAGSGGGRPPKGGAPSTGGAVVGGATATGGTSIMGGTGGDIGTAGAAMGGVSMGGASSGGIGGVGVGGAAGAAGEPSVPDVACGNDRCEAGREVCCVSVAGFACIGNGRTCNGAVLDCTSASDCTGGDVCCLGLATPTGSVSSCKDRCAPANPESEWQLCSSDAECRGNRRCTQTVFGVSVCSRRP